ncbi:uncharacterized protein BKA55DRAFT_544596 [Fusarium redolens]|uniref:CBM-cenC domain-containing protein n=1 Tax=Fusarium redolens TaxID=48865 RepID=A0A9P9JPI0_FUSRE|nr:uncharacterized protein BKA55DRAFT_544596 [Fusarium redolens]KAH7232258.1 hypothetical protein BKA55DRAFT_544596 [Fusarium redolens]
MSLRAVVAACAIFALASVNANPCKPSSSSSASIGSTVTLSTSTQTEASSSTDASSTALISITTTTAAEETPSAAAETSATSTTSAAPEETLFLLNAGFDNGGAGWTAGPGAGFLSDANYRTNPGSAVVAVTEVGEASASWISAQLGNLVPGQEYEVSLYWFLDWFVPGGDQCTYGFFLDGVGHTYAASWINGDRSLRRISDSFTAARANPVFEFKLWCTYFYDTGESDWSPLVNAYIDDADIIAT